MEPNSTQQTKPARRRSAEATKDLLIETATEMMFENPGATGLDTIRIADVVVRAGRTVGSAYQIWGSGKGQPGFRRDLTQHVARLAVTDSTATISMLRSATDVTSMSELIGVVTDHYLRLFETEGAPWAVGLSLMVAAPYNPDLREILDEEFAVTLAAYSAVFSDMLDAAGYRMRDGRPVEDLVTALNAVVNGFFLRVRLNPETVIPPATDSASTDSASTDSASTDSTSTTSGARKNLLHVSLEAVVDALVEEVPK